MALTGGGLVKHSVQFTPDELAWCRAQSEAHGKCGVSSIVRKALEAGLEQSPRDFGLNRTQWDGPTLVVHLRRRFGITLRVRQAQYWMHRLGYRLKRASYSYLQARAEDARRFRRQLKKTPKPEVE